MGLTIHWKLKAASKAKARAGIKKYGGLAAIAIFTSQTCGEACWHAREDVCRCSCGGRNHGCLRNGSGARPERTSRISGIMYRLRAVGKHRDIYADACEINRLAGYRSVDRPHLVASPPGPAGVFCITIDGTSKSWTPEEIEQAKARGAEMWWSQYSYTWSTTDEGAPARLKTASDSQRKWQELSGWKEEDCVYLLWERVDKPTPPTEKVVNKETGLPEENQLPKSCF